MIRTTAVINNPDKISMTLTIEMTIGEWTEIHDHLGKADAYWPFGKLREAIRMTIGKATRQVTEIADNL